MRRQEPAAGFTLLELIMVLLLLSVLTGMAVPAFRHYHERISVRMEALRLVETMQYARERAVMSRRPQVVHFDAGRGLYWLSDGDESHGTSHRRRVLPFPTKIRTGVSKAVFHPDGTATEAWLRLERRSVSCEVRLDALSGRGRLFEPEPAAS